MIDLSFWRLWALMGSLAPGVIIVLLLLRLGRRRLSPRLLAIAAASGAMIAVLPLTVSLLEPLARGGLDTMSFFLVRAFGLAGVSEEGAKLLVCWFIVAPHFRRRGKADLVLACAGVGLGFALIENFVYVLRAAEGWKNVAFARSVAAIPAHVFIGLAMGYGLTEAEIESDRLRRAAKVARAWLGAALLHGCYDLPLFLAEILPQAPLKVVQLAALLSVTKETLVSGASFAAVTMNARAALRAIAFCRADLARGDGWDERWRAPLSPALLDRLVFARATGLVVGGLSLTLAAAGVGIGVVATASGALPMQMLFLVAVSVTVGALGWAFGRDDLLALPEDVRRFGPALAAFARRRRWTAGALATASGGALAGLLYFGEVGARHAVAALLVENGVWLALVGDVDHAIASYAAALSFVPDFLLAFEARADAYRMMQDYDRALADLDRALELHPKEAGARAGRGAIFALRHESARALDEFDAALTLDPDNATLVVGRGEARIDAGDLEGALSDAERALRLRPELSSVHALRGAVFREKDQTSLAIAEYSKTIQRAPKDAPAYFARGRLYFEEGNFGAAANDFARAAATGERNYVILWLFLARARTGADARLELAYWTQAAARGFWPYPLAELYLGQKDLARVEASAKTDDQKCELSFYVGEWRLLSKNMEEAARYLADAVERCPKSFIETRAARKELERLRPSLDSSKTKPPAIGLSAPWATTSRETVARPTSKPIWRQTSASALTIERIPLPDGGAGTLKLAPASDAAPGGEYALNLTAPRKRGEANAVTMSVEGVLDVKFKLGFTGFFAATLSRGDVERLIEALKDGRRIDILLDTAIKPNPGFRAETVSIEVDDDAKTQVKAWASAVGLIPSAPAKGEAPAHAVSLAWSYVAQDLLARAKPEGAPIESRSREGDALAAVDGEDKRPLAEIIARDEKVRRHTAMVRVEVLRSKIPVTVLDAKLLPNGSLVLQIRVSNHSDRMVKLGEMTVGAVRFLNPRVFLVVPAYPKPLVKPEALSVEFDPIVVGEARNLTLTVADFGAAVQLEPSEGRATERLDGALSFYGPRGERTVSAVSGVVTRTK